MAVLQISTVTNRVIIIHLPSQIVIHLYNIINYSFDHIRYLAS